MPKVAHRSACRAVRREPRSSDTAVGRAATRTAPAHNLSPSDADVAPASLGDRQSHVRAGGGETAAAGDDAATAGGPGGDRPPTLKRIG